MAQQNTADDGSTATLMMHEFDSGLEIVVTDLPADRQMDADLRDTDGLEWARDHIKVDESAVVDIVETIESHGHTVNNELTECEDGDHEAERQDE